MKKAEVVAEDRPFHCNKCDDEINFCDDCLERFKLYDEIYCDRDERGHICTICA